MELPSQKIKGAGYINRAGWKFLLQKLKEQDILREQGRNKFKTMERAGYNKRTESEKWAGAEYEYILNQEL